MRHGVRGSRLGRATAQRKALLAGLAQDLFKHGRLKTTLTRAKALRPFSEPLLTLAGEDTLHARRRIASLLPDKAIQAKLFSDLGKRFKGRPGGYTRILKMGYRTGDSSPMALIELVD